MENTYSYDNDLALDQSIIVEDENINVYRIWDQQFTKETIQDELSKEKLELVRITSDLTGKEFEDTSKMMGLIAKKIFR